MHKTENILSRFRSIAENPKAQLAAIKDGGKKAVGVMPYFCPEELVDAAGMIPFGVWGAQLQVSEAKRYFPSFYCSILQTTLELGMRGELDALSAIMVPISCDSLKCMGTNWECAVPHIPVINVAHAQNRKTEAGVQFTVSQYKKIAGQLSEISGIEPTDERIAASVSKFNENRQALREFAALAAKHLQTVSPINRNAVIKAGYFMDKSEHTAFLKELNAELSAMPEEQFDGLRVVTSGIIADAPELLQIFEDNKIAIVADQLAHETVYFREDAPVTEDPIVGLAQRIGNIEGCSVLYDLGKNRVKDLENTIKESGADAAIFIQSKFCDPDEFDYPILKNYFAEKRIPLLQIEFDQQSGHFEQIKSTIQAFSEMHCI